jgi:transposase
MAVIEGGERRIVGGVDTHKDLHVAAVVDDQDRVRGPARARGPADSSSSRAP